MWNAYEKDQSYTRGTNQLYFPNQFSVKASTASEPGFQKRELNLSVLSRMIKIKKKVKKQL
jgi:hypothetical protein